MENGYVKVAAITPEIKVADCAYNAKQIITSLRKAQDAGVEIAVLPELCLTGYTCGDLFSQKILQQGTIAYLLEIAKETAAFDMLIAIGAPLASENKLYNCAVLLHRGNILGVIPKTFLPNYSEFYEMRHFSPAPQASGFMQIGESEIPFGTKLLFCCDTIPGLQIAAEICEDLWAVAPPSISHALAGATVIFNLSASDEIVGKAAYRRSLVTGQSARLLCGYVYADAGNGESTTDMVFAGHNIISENGSLLAESTLFENGIVTSEIDLEHLAFERQRNTSFIPSENDGYTKIHFSLSSRNAAFTRHYSPAPFVPQNKATCAEYCDDILTMQANGLQKRLMHTHSETAVIGISGGLDSSLALLVAVRAFQNTQRPLQNIIAVTMPCFGTTQRTRSNAAILCDALGVTLREVNITDTVRSNFSDIGQAESTQDVTFENTQARVRTLVLMNMANKLNGMVIGTGDLSELALGWATYNGDHMSMYGVNASVPKTLIRHLVGHVADTCENTALHDVLYDILDTPVSPELLPAENGEISQQTEALVGPYELHDFFLYYVIRRAYTPGKIFYLAQNAFAEKYDDATLLHWLGNFYKRFFAQQFKRNCMPDGPKVGSVTLSPRGDWRMPSDAIACLWLDEVDKLKNQSKKV